MHLLRTIGGVDFTRQERATLNKLTMPRRLYRIAEAIASPRETGFLHRLAPLARR